MNSADAWHASNDYDGDDEEGWVTSQGHPVIPDGFRYDPSTVTRFWPNDPNGSLVPILEASVEAAKQRHPSGKDVAPAEAEPLAIALGKADRCDHCGAEALYRIEMSMATPELARPTLEFCHHHHDKHFPGLEVKGWKVVGTNLVLMEALYGKAT